MWVMLRIWLAASISTTSETFVVYSGCKIEAVSQCVTVYSVGNIKMKIAHCTQWGTSDKLY